MLRRGGGEDKIRNFLPPPHTTPPPPKKKKTKPRRIFEWNRGNCELFMSTMHTINYRTRTIRCILYKLLLFSKIKKSNKLPPTPFKNPWICLEITSEEALEFKRNYSNIISIFYLQKSFSIAHLLSTSFLNGKNLLTYNISFYFFSTLCEQIINSGLSTRVKNIM